MPLNLVIPKGRMADSVIFVALSLLFFTEILFGAVLDMPEYWYQEGDLLLGYVGDIAEAGQDEKYCGEKVSPAAVYRTEAMALAVREVNRRRDLLPNVTLGFIIFDGCTNPQAALARSFYLLKDIEELKGLLGRGNSTGNDTQPLLISDNVQRHFDVVGVIGPELSAQAFPVARLFSVFQIPVISTSASGDELGDISRYGYFARMVPSDRITVDVLTQIVKQFGWEYVIILSSYGQWSEMGKSLEEKLESRGVCVGFSYKFALYPTGNDVTFVTEQLKIFHKAKVIVSFIHPTDMYQVQKSMLLENITGQHLWVIAFPDDLSPSPDLIPDAALVLRPLSAELKSFDRYLKIRKPWTLPENPWLRILWEQGFNCQFDARKQSNISACKEIGDITDMTQFVPAKELTDLSRIYDAVNIFAHSLHEAIVDTCPNAFITPGKVKNCVKGSHLMRIIKEISIQSVFDRHQYSFNEDGEPNSVLHLYQHFKTQEEVLVDSYSTRNTSIDTNPFKPNVLNFSALRGSQQTLSDTASLTDYSFISTCRVSCPEHHVGVKDDMPCCWKCVPCLDNEIVTNSGSGFCKACPSLFWPDDTFMECKLIPPTHLMWTNLNEIILLGLAMLEVLAAITIAIVFFTRWDHKLSRATGFGINNLIILGIIVSCGNVAFLTRKPSQLFCVIQKVLLHIACTSLFASLFIRILFLRLFILNTDAPDAVSPRTLSAQFYLSFALISLQGIGLFVSEYFLPTAAVTRMPYSHVAYVDVICSENYLSLVAHFSYEGALLVLAWYMTMSLQGSGYYHNESTLLRITVLFCLALYVAGITTYIFFEKEYIGYFIRPIFLLGNGFVALLFYLCPKVYAICCIESEKIRVKPVGSLSIAPKEQHESGNPEVGSGYIA